jgi:alpha-glucosidase
MNPSFRFIHTFFVLGLALSVSAQKPVQTLSPDGKISIVMQYSNSIDLTISNQGKEIARFSQVSLNLKEHPEAYRQPVLRTVTYDPHNSVITPVVAEKRKLIPDVYNETAVWFKGGYGIKFRAYNDGAAWKFITRYPDSLTVVWENFNLEIPRCDSMYFGEEDNFISHSERLYPYKAINDIAAAKMCVLPAVFRNKENHILAFSESGLHDYPGLYLEKAEGKTFKTILPKAAASETISSDRRSFIVSSRHDYIARTSGSREFPWRVLGISANDAGLLSNDIIYRLGNPCKLTDTEWIKPGKVAWDWWNNWNIWDVPFKAGINTATYKYYIDFASAHGLEYVILDEGWSDNDDLNKINPELDMEELFSYAAKKNVRLILWVTGRALEEIFESSLAKFEKWGAAGIKVDFLIRDDQRMVNYYEKVAEAAARHHLLVDYHGSYKPTGLSRTYPNALTREGVQGSENNKWSKNITPEHDCTIPFTRMFAGPMDYTPGAMNNVTQENFYPAWSEPMSMGTRCHELAKYVIFESPLQMLCDAPGNYMKEKECMEFLSAVPSSWDETFAIDARIGEYIVIARQLGNEFYIGAMTNSQSREIKIPLSFLPEGNYLLKSWEDGINAGRKARDFRVNSSEVTKSSVISIHLAPGGGYAARLEKK